MKHQLVNGLLKKALFKELSTAMLYHLLQLRAHVFVVEQHCPYNDLDGRDLEPDTVHYWIELPPDVASGLLNGEVIAYLRCLKDDDGIRRIGRVVTHPGYRGKQLANQLMDAVLSDFPEDGFRLDAQSYLKTWYARFGFNQHGDEFLEDGIPHTPMQRLILSK